MIGQSYFDKTVFTEVANGLVRKNCAVGICTEESFSFTNNIWRIVGPLAIFILLGNGTDVVDWFKSMAVT